MKKDLSPAVGLGAMVVVLAFIGVLRLNLGSGASSSGANVPILTKRLPASQAANLAAAMPGTPSQPGH